MPPWASFLLKSDEADRNRSHFSERLPPSENFRLHTPPTNLLLQTRQRFLATKEKCPSVARDVTALCNLTINQTLLSFQLPQPIFGTFQCSVKFSLIFQYVSGF